jgi:HD-like signal output (HDOD) protein
MALLLKRASPSTDMKEMDSGHKPTSEPAVSGYYETLEKAMSERLEKGDFQLPILPVIAAKLIGKLSHGNEDLDAIAELMQGDQTLAGHVLRFANSVLYGGHIPAETLQEAIARVGFNVIGELATVLTFGNNIFRSKGLQSLMDDIQEHAVLTAFLARDLGKATSGPSDQLFLCGLLHTVGKPILLQLVTTMGVMIPMRPPYDELREIVERLHHRAGSIACDRWNLPATVKASCTHYNDPDKAGEQADLVRDVNQASQLASIVQQAGTLEPADVEAVLKTEDPQVLSQFNALLEPCLNEANSLIAIMQP